MVLLFLYSYSFTSCSARFGNVSTLDGTAEGLDHPVSTLCGHTEPRVPPLRRRVSQRHTKEKFELGRTKRVLQCIEPGPAAS